jgi:hypothetical protein
MINCLAVEGEEHKVYEMPCIKEEYDLARDRTRYGVPRCTDSQLCNRAGQMKDKTNPLPMIAQEVKILSFDKPREWLRVLGSTQTPTATNAARLSGCRASCSPYNVRQKRNACLSPVSNPQARTNHSTRSASSAHLHGYSPAPDCPSSWNGLGLSGPLLPSQATLSPRAPRVCLEQGDQCHSHRTSDRGGGCLSSGHLPTCNLLVKLLGRALCPALCSLRGTGPQDPPNACRKCPYKMQLATIEMFFA